jgi:hypothetical protein
MQEVRFGKKTTKASTQYQTICYYNKTKTKAFGIYTNGNLYRTYIVYALFHSLARENFHLCGVLLFVLLEATNSTQYRQKNISI